MNRSHLLIWVIAASAAAAPLAQGRRGQEPGPTITAHGQTFTQLSLFQRNVGGPDGAH